jgi:hypothetical protein
VIESFEVDTGRGDETLPHFNPSMLPQLLQDCNSVEPVGYRAHRRDETVCPQHPIDEKDTQLADLLLGKDL